ncbi:MAG TPA: transcriptional regulator [Actinomycetes bacterium]|jgi:transcriptional regulator with XRE-family HTH domain|nr:transcriptional regulator [Actinomycetes bacterium]
MASYAEQVGERLRNIRLQKGLSLHDVEQRSAKEFKASVLGAYERGERSISVPRLQRLAMFYGVPVDHLLPRLGAGAEAAPPPEAAAEGAVCIDLEALQARREPEAQTLGRYLTLIQTQRGDFNGKMLTIRRDDVRVLAAILDQSPGSLIARLDDLGLRRPAYS